MTKIQKESKKAEWCQKILAVAMSESGKSGLLPTTRVASAFDSLEYLEFILKLGRELGPLPNEKAAEAETFNDLAEGYASST